MYRNVTIRIPEALLKKAKCYAIKHGQSLSQLVIRAVEALISADDEYKAAFKRILKRMKKGFPLGGKPIPREELYDRHIKPR